MELTHFQLNKELSLHIDLVGLSKANLRDIA